MKKIVFGISLMVSIPVFAEFFQTPSAIPNNFHVYDAYGNSYVDLVPYNCSGIRYYITPNHIKYDAIVSTILTAQVAKKKLHFRVDGCNSQNQGIIVGVYLHD